MFFVRKIMVLYALAIASGGPLPLVLHQFTCHHDVTQHQPSDAAGQQPVCQHSCLHHHPASMVEGGSAENLNPNHDEECSLCYQLSQVSVGSFSASADLIHLVCSNVVAFVDLLDLAAVYCPYPSRGPPIL